MPGFIGTPFDPLPQTGTPYDSPFLGDPDGVVALAMEQVGQANSLALSLVGLAGSLVAPTITPTFPTDDVPPAVATPDLPTFQQVAWVSPNIPEAFSGTIDIDGLMPEAFDDDPPTLSFPTPPAPFSDAAPDAPGIVTSFDDPTLSLSLPAAPDLIAINVTPFEGLNMPTFSADEPTLSVVEPSIVEYVPGGAYTSALLTAMQTSLQERISGGGTGLGAEAETALWERGREREARAGADALRQLDDRMEGLGYTLPPGLWVDARIKIITETDAAERGHSREVMIKSAELELENVKHALSVASNVESTLIQYNNSVEQRAFEATKYATEAGIALYNAKVEAFGRLVEVYRTKVQVYTAQIQAETAKVDAYRAQIDAERAKADINNALVNQYRVQADVALSAIEVYKAQIEGIRTKAEIEKTKVMIFGEQVRAYATRVNAYTAGVEGFRASLEAERTKQQVYQSAVEAFSARVSAAAKQIDARIAVYEGEIKAKGIEWDGYQATISGESARIEGIVKGNQALADVYRAQVSGYSSLNDALTKQWEVVIDRNGRTAEIAIQAAKANAELYITGRNLLSDAAKSSAQITAQLGAAALNAINWSSSISTGTSNSHSSVTSHSNSYSASDSYGIGYNYNYNE
jgi:hypothetical protein